MSQDMMFVYRGIKAKILRLAMEMEPIHHHCHEPNMIRSNFAQMQASLEVALDENVAHLDLKRLIEREEQQKSAMYTVPSQGTRYWGTLLHFRFDGALLNSDFEGEKVLQVRLGYVFKANAPKPTEIKWGSLRSACARAGDESGASAWRDAWSYAGEDHLGELSPGELYLVQQAVRSGRALDALQCWIDGQRLKEELEPGHGLRRLAQLMLSQHQLDKDQADEVRKLLEPAAAVHDAAGGASASLP